MSAILTAAEMRALERAAIESGAVTGLELMERAGRGVVEAILAEWPGIEEGGGRAVVLCGPGNNGGDGFVVARMLAEIGWSVTALAFPLTERMPPDAAASRRALPPTVRVLDFDAVDDTTGNTFASEVADAVWDGEHRVVHVIDALFGTGLARAAEAPFWIGQELNGWDAEGRVDELRVVAVDLPSGLCADNGRVLRPEDWRPSDDPIRAHMTVTFASLKPAHLLADGPGLCGKVVVADIGLALPHRPEGLESVHHDWRAARTKREIGKRVGHKYAHGHAVILSGGPGRGGAARLAARGALRIGAGLVTLAVPPAALQENAARLDAIMLRSARDAEALAGLLGDDRLNAICIGPGFGTGERQAAMLGVLLDVVGAEQAENRKASAAYVESLYPPRPADDRVMRAMAGLRPKANRHVVLDADALTILAAEEALRAKLHAACVLTPHEGEFARLFPAIDAAWRAPATTGPTFSKVDAARAAAREAGCVVLLKGPDTVIADPSGRAAINAAVYDRAAPWLATAGSGDVLAGFITGLLARGLAPFDAACTAAWLHVECARSFGPGLIAEDLPEELPKVFRALGL